jgi:hypothetical protein
MHHCSKATHSQQTKYRNPGNEALDLPVDIHDKNNNNILSSTSKSAVRMPINKAL